MSTIESEATPPIPAAILDAVFALNESQRLALGHQLIESVEDDLDAGHPGWPEDWEEELERRALAVERGDATLSREEVEDRIRETLRRAKVERQSRNEASS